MYREPILDLSFEDIVGYRVAGASRDALVGETMGYLTEGAGGCRYFACLNPHAVEVAADDPGFAAALRAADYLTPDGIGVVYASKLLGGSLRDRVTGMEIFEGLSGAMNQAGGLSCFFLGSTTETLEKIRQTMNERYPAVRVAGTYSPPYRPEFTA